MRGGGRGEGSESGRVEGERRGVSEGWTGVRGGGREE